MPLVSLLLALTLTFLIFPPVMLGSIAYSVVTLLVIWILGAQYWMLHPSLKPRAMIACYVIGRLGVVVLSDRHDCVWVARPDLFSAARA